MTGTLKVKHKSRSPQKTLTDLDNYHTFFAHIQLIQLKENYAVDTTNTNASMFNALAWLIATNP